MIDNIEDLIKLYTKYFHLEDTSIIPFVVGIILANRMPGDPIWGMIVGSSSSGKSEVVNAVTDMEIGGKKRVWQISSLTENTFLSGMANQKTSTSLLTKIGTSGIIVMKDFTTLLSEYGDRAAVIFAQMREIYDGYITKETGTGKSLSWKGKLNFIGCVTEKIYMMEKKYGGMGTRAVNFHMPSADRKITTRAAIRNSRGIEAIREEIKIGFTQYIQAMSATLETYIPEALPVDVVDRILDVADFAAMARSSTERDFRGELQLTQSPEMPMRLAKQLSSLATVFTFMQGGTLSADYERIVYKVALDSIPLTRRMALRELARYDDVTTAGVATKLSYPTATAREWLEDLNVLGICDRVKGASGLSVDKWKLRESYRKVMEEFDGIKPIPTSLSGGYADAGGNAYGEDVDPGELEAYEQNLQADFDALTG